MRLPQARSVRARDLARWEDDVCGTGESRRCSRGECRRGTVLDQGILRHTTSAPELLRCGAGSSGIESRRFKAVRSRRDHGRNRGARHNEVDCAAAKKGMEEPIGFLPTEWMPMSMAYTGGKLYVATAKGKGAGPNNFTQRQADWQKSAAPSRRRRAISPRCSMARWRCWTRRRWSRSSRDGLEKW